MEYCQKTCKRRDDMAEDEIRLDEKTKKFLMSSKVVPEIIEIKGHKFIPKVYAGSGLRGVVWKGKDEWGTDVAIKLATAKDYMERSFLQEASMANRLRGYPRFAEFIDVGTIEISFPDGSKSTFVCFIEEWVDGPTLEQYLQNEKNIPSTFLIEYIKMMCEALNNLKYNELCHGDLHPGNIKIAPPKPGSLTKFEIEIKVIDTGSLKHVLSRKEIDDHQWFIRHIIEIRNAIYRRKKLSISERRFLRNIIPLLDKMLDEDKMVALTDPPKIMKQFESVWKESQSSKNALETKLQDPFHYISAETIHSDKLLVDLFAESCPWKNDVQSPDPLVLTGPRGCGKSTIFRRLSLKGMLCKGMEEVVDSEIAGFYISCSSDLRNRVNWINNENLARKFRGEILHYFNLLLTREIIHTMNIISLRDDKEKVFGFGSSEERGLYEFIVKKLKMTSADSLRLQGVSPMERILEIVDTEMEKCHEAMVRGRSWKRKTSASYMSDLTRFLNEKIGYFSRRKIIFFIDDLSTRQIPKEVQTVLNSVILLERSKNHIFKISSDKYGWVGLDLLASTGEKMREFREVDCGKFYLVEADSDTKRTFTKELLEKRLELSNFEGKPEEIIGHSTYEEGSLGKAIRYRLERKKRPNVYFGLETITNLCSGDICVLLEIFRRIFERGKVTPHSHDTVPPYIQDDAIVSVSREFFAHIKNYHPHGNEMYSIINHFGTLCRMILQKGKFQRKNSGSVPSETTRIEVDEDPSQAQIELSNKQKEIMDELIKRAIFIELNPGRARHGLTPSLRWQLRPVLCPTFATSLSKNTAVKWKPEEFRYFLNAPEEKCSAEFEKWKRRGKSIETGPPLTEWLEKKDKEAE
jgi:hypothetical protein